MMILAFVGAMLVMSALALVGLAVLDGAGIDPWIRAAIAPLLGAAVYVGVGTGFVVLTGHMTPLLTFAVTLAFGLALILGRRDTVITRWPATNWQSIAMTLGWIIAVTALAEWLSLGRITPDSIRYLVNADLLTEPGKLQVMADADFVKRVAAEPLLHTLGVFDGRNYSATIGPVVGLAGWLMVLRLTWQRIATKRIGRWAGVVLMCGFLVSANRPLFNLFYINSHGFVASCVLVAVFAGWRIIEGDHRWWPALGICGGMVPLARPEGGATVALIWLALVIAADQGADRSLRLAALFPAAASTLWFGGGALVHGNRRLAVETSVILVSGWLPLLLTWVIRIAPTLRGRLPMFATVAMAGSLLAAAANDVHPLLQALRATFDNLFLGKGGWGITWPILGVVVVISHLYGSVHNARVWTWFIGGFGMLYLLLPYLRDGSYRAGTGDTGNRILAHVFLVSVVYVLLALTSSTPDEPSVAGL